MFDKKKIYIRSQKFLNQPNYFKKSFHLTKPKLHFIFQQWMKYLLVILKCHKCMNNILADVVILLHADVWATVTLLSGIRAHTRSHNCLGNSDKHLDYHLDAAINSYQNVYIKPSITALIFHASIRHSRLRFIYRTKQNWLSSDSIMPLDYRTNYLPWYEFNLLRMPGVHI